MNNELRVGGRITYKEPITFSTFSEMVGKGIIIMKKITELRICVMIYAAVKLSFLQSIILRNPQRIHLDLISMFAQKEINLHVVKSLRTNTKYLRKFNWTRIK